MSDGFLKTVFHDKHGKPHGAAHYSVLVTLTLFTLAAGLFYSFSLFGDQLKIALSCTEAQVNLIYVGGYIACQGLQALAMPAVANMPPHVHIRLSAASAPILGGGWVLLALSLQSSFAVPYAAAFMGFTMVGLAIGFTCISLNCLVSLANMPWVRLLWSAGSASFALGGAAGAIVVETWFDTQEALPKFLYFAAAFNFVTVLAFALALKNLQRHCEREEATVMHQLLQPGANAPASAANATVWEELKICCASGSFWLCCVVCFCWSLLGGIIMSDDGGMVAALAGSGSQVRMTVLVVSFANAIGRIFYAMYNSYAPESSVRAGACIWMGATACVGAAVLLMASTIPLTILGCSLLVTCYGGGMVTITGNVSELRLLREESLVPLAFASGMVGIAPFVGEYVVGQLYDDQVYNPHGAVCHGRACFHNGFWFVLSVSILMTICASLLYWRVRAHKNAKPYQKADAQSFLRHDEQES